MNLNFLTCTLRAFPNPRPLGLGPISLPENKVDKTLTFKLKSQALGALPQGGLVAGPDPSELGRSLWAGRIRRSGPSEQSGPWPKARRCSARDHSSRHWPQTTTLYFPSVPVGQESNSFAGRVCSGLSGGYTQLSARATGTGAGGFSPKWAHARGRQLEASAPLALGFPQDRLSVPLIRQLVPRGKHPKRESQSALHAPTLGIPHHRFCHILLSGASHQARPQLGEGQSL